MSSANAALDNYELPGLWTDYADRTADAWAERSAQLVDLFAAHVYGQTPAGGALASLTERSRREVFGGSALRREFTLTVAGPLGTRELSMLLYTPQGIAAPALLGLNFEGNHSTTTDQDVRISRAWMKAPAARGNQERRWPYRDAIDRGYAVATLHYSEIEEDRPGAAGRGVRGLFHTAQHLEQARQPTDWGAIGAWAWGLSRAFDALEQLPEIDSTRVIAHGHSRLGKTALWAVAQDRRFAGAISNDSGCAGASLFRHRTGENIHMITRDFPHWFSARFNDFRDAEENLPLDQHLLLAAIAPRPVHVASATLDAHADPRGEFLSTVHASPVFGLFGARGTHEAPAGTDVSAAEAAVIPQPAPGSRVGSRLSYSLREGEHDVLAEDWRHFMDFADENLPGMSADSQA